MAGKRRAKQDAGSGNPPVKAESLVVDNAVPMSATAAVAPSVVLPVDCRMAAQLSLKNELTARLGASAIAFDGRQVDRVDTAALQLLLLFRRDVVKRGGVISWLGASDVLNEAANLLGLAQTLELPAAALA